MKAFPTSRDALSFEKGMDLRDWFAGLAMQALISSWILRSEYPETDSVVAERAYQMAERMMVQRNKYENNKQV